MWHFCTCYYSSITASRSFAGVCYLGRCIECFKAPLQASHHSADVRLAIGPWLLLVLSPLPSAFSPHSPRSRKVDHIRKPDRTNRINNSPAPSKQFVPHTIKGVEVD